MVCLTLALASGCGGSGATDSTTAAATTSAPSSADRLLCGEPANGIETVAFSDADGAEIPGALVGEGPIGLVLGHQRNSDLCSWLPFARSLDTDEFQALAFTFAGELENNVAAGASFLRDRGARAIVLMGASMGGTASLVAAGSIRPTVEGVVTLSAPRELSGLDAGHAVRRLDVSVLFVAGKGDTDFAVDARRLYRASRSMDKHLLLADDFAHGTDLLDGPEGARIRREVLRFVERAVGR